MTASIDVAGDPGPGPGPGSGAGSRPGPGPGERAVADACPEMDVCLAVPAWSPWSDFDLLLVPRPGVDPQGEWEERVRTTWPGSVGDVLVVTREWLVRHPGGALDRTAMERRYRDFRMGAWLPGLGPGARPEPRPAARVPVAFAGPGAGRAVLTWGQRDIWATMLRQRNWLPQGGRRPLAAGTSVADVAEELAYLHGRYPVMRTRLAFEDGGPEGPPLVVRQVLASAGQTFLEVFDTRPGQDADSVAARVEAMYRRRPYDLREEWPIRMAVVRDGEACTHLVVIMNHLALDAGGAAVMFREVAARETGTPPGMQPLEQAAWQASEAGQRHSARTLRYFSDALRALPAGPSPAVLAGPRRPRHWTGRFVSPSLTGAVAAVGARTGVDESAVLTAVIGTAFARLTGTDRVLIRPRVGNRFRPALVGVVCFVAQSGLLVVDLAGTTFDEAVERARRATMAGLKNAYFDPDALETLLARLAAERGGEPGIQVFLNDRHAAKPTVDYTSSAAPSARDLGSVRGRSTFRWLERGPEPTEPLSLTIDDAEGALALGVHFDTEVIGPEAVEELVWGVERAAVEAALDGDAPTGL